MIKIKNLMISTIAVLLFISLIGIASADDLTESSTEASPGVSGENTTNETTDEEEPGAIPGFTAMTILIAAVIGIMLRSSTKKE
jgi:hypothetical protein